MKNNIPKLRFKEFIDEWQEKRLGDVAEFYKGVGLSKEETRPDGKIRCVRYGELYTDYNEVIMATVSGTNTPQSKLFIGQSNDILIPSSGETSIDIAKAVCVKADNIAFGGDLNIIRSKNDGIFLSYYLNYARKKQIVRIAQGHSVVHLYSSQLKGLTINLPEVDEQEKVAGFLTAVDDKINKLEEKKKGFEKYKKGVMQAIFSQKIRFKKNDGSNYRSWEMNKFDDLFLVVPSRSYQIFNSEFKNSGKFPVIDQGNQRIAGFTENESKLFKEWPVIIFGDHTTFLKYIDFSFVVGADGTKILKAFGDNNLKFLYYSLEFNKIEPEGYKRHYSVLKLLKFKIPNIEEQEKIAEFLTSLDNKVELINKELEQAKLFKKSLLQQMFV